ncbi:dTDP-4-dehydrorhamnose 3,5-epimerase family protein [Cysteiniphilum halobium]|uniref:dTDP-4-dehydrorhamnose 3,5-epimerase family protein n=1 Tax=Cysteiniphilum halobium TaxID=2219059 RepID=UPI000E657E1A|nr:dTDP-4-dehydrorhamnose 3,5-epimerase [Cysteiniphilum halobium]
MKFNELVMPGVYEVHPNVIKDSRGVFIKTFHEEVFHENGLQETLFKEEYYSISAKGALRGLHFQLPPDDHVKLVYCINGQVQDILLDLRKGSPTYLKAISIELSDKKANILYIPKGIAHGFLTLSPQAIMVYKTSTVYNPTSDFGVHWMSCENIWKISSLPILSKRDKNHPLLSEFESPFVF